MYAENAIIYTLSNIIANRNNRFFKKIRNDEYSGRQMRTVAASGKWDVRLSVMKKTKYCPRRVPCFSAYSDRPLLAGVIQHTVMKKTKGESYRAYLIQDRHHPKKTPFEFDFPHPQCYIP